MRVRRNVLSAIEAHARREAPLECCGLLVADSSAIVEAVPCRNAADDPAHRYVIAPEEFFAQIRRCRLSARPMRVVGAYHSHPHSVPVPSPTDRAEAFAGFLYLIAGPVDGPVAIRGWELAGGNLQAVALVTDPEEDPS